MPDNETLGRRLRLIRVAAQLTQTELADKVNLNTTTVSKIEAGNRPIRADELVRWCQICKALPSEVLSSEPLTITEAAS